jgi:hypothetical protein
LTHQPGPVRPGPARPAGDIQASLNLNTGAISASGRLTLTFRLDCGASSRISSKFSSLIPTMTCVIEAGYSPLYGAGGCSESFPRGVAYLGGSVTAQLGGWYLGASFTVEAKGFIGLRCSDRQARDPPLQ